MCALRRSLFPSESLTYTGLKSKFPAFLNCNPIRRNLLKPQLHTVGLISKPARLHKYNQDEDDDDDNDNDINNNNNNNNNFHSQNLQGCLLIPCFL
jgi:hypothetical protein